MRASQRGCFPFLCAGRSVNASAHYLRPSLSFFQSRLATLTPRASSKFFFFFLFHHFSFTPPFTQPGLVMTDPLDASEN